MPDARAQKRPWSDEEKDQLRALIKEGISYSKIAARLGRNSEGIRSKIKELRSEALAVGDDERDEDGMNVLRVGLGGYDRRYSDDAVRAASAAFSDAIRSLFGRREIDTAA